MRREKEVDAASRIEELMIMAKEMILRLRLGQEPHPYAAVYWLRRELGYVVATLGVGVPDTTDVEPYYHEYLVNEINKF